MKVAENNFITLAETISLTGEKGVTDPYSYKIDSHQSQGHR